MARPRKLFKPSKSTISISEEKLQEMVSSKKHKQTWSEFVTMMYDQWKSYSETIKEWKDTVPFMDDLIKDLQKKVKELNEVIEVLNKDKTELENELKKYKKKVVIDTELEPLSVQAIFANSNGDSTKK